MKYKIDKSTHTPAYIQLYIQLRDDIIKRNYKFGERLPSKRLLAQESYTSVITVEHAYALLCDEGYAAAREKSGYFVSFNSDAGFYRQVKKNPQFKAFSQHSNDICEFPFSVFAKTARRVINDYGKEILEKSDNGGNLRLKDALGRYLRQNRGIDAANEQIIIGSGAEYLYSLVIGILGRDRIFAIENPSYEKIEQVYRSQGVKTESLMLGEDGIKSDALLKSCADVLHITPYRSYPTGISSSASKRYEYISWASVKDRFIVEDDFESEFSVLKKPEETLFATTERENVIYINTFSRTLSPALRMGYMVLPARLLDTFYDRLGFYSCTVPTLEQLILAEIIESGDFQRHINRQRRRKRSEMKNKE